MPWNSLCFRFAIQWLIFDNNKCIELTYMSGEEEVSARQRLRKEWGKVKESFGPEPTQVRSLILPFLQKEAMWAGSVVTAGPLGRAPPDLTWVPPWCVGFISTWIIPVPPWSLTAHTCQGTVTSKAHSVAHLAQPFLVLPNRLCSSGFLRWSRPLPLYTQYWVLFRGLK